MRKGNVSTSLLKLASALLCAFFAFFADMSAYEFPTGEGGMGSSNSRGHADVWIEVGESLELCEDIKIPLRLNFCSAQENCSDSVLGDGWWIPSIESSIVMDGDGSVVMRLPGGARRRLVPLGGVDSRAFGSMDGEWKAVPVNDTAIRVNGPDGLIFEFDRGRLQKMISRNGEVVRWYWKDGRVHEISSESEFGDSVEIKYGSDGLISSMHIRGRSDSCALNFSSGRAPVFAVINGYPVVSDLKPMVSAIDVDGKRLASMEVVSTAESNVALEMRNETGAFLEREDAVVVWDPSSRKILRDREWSYSSNSAEDRRGFVDISRVNLRNGLEESKKYDPNRGLSEFVHLDGSRAVITEVYVAGKRRIREHSYFTPDGAETVMFKASYSESGDVLRGFKRGVPSDEPASIITKSSKEVRSAFSSEAGIDGLFLQISPKR